MEGPAAGEGGGSFSSFLLNAFFSQLGMAVSCQQEDALLFKMTIMGASHKGSLLKDTSSGKEGCSIGASCRILEIYTVFMRSGYGDGLNFEAQHGLIV